MKTRRLDNGNLPVPVGDERWLPHIEEADTRHAKHPAGRPGGSNPEAG